MVVLAVSNPTFQILAMVLGSCLECRSVVTEEMIAFLASFSDMAVDTLASVQSVSWSCNIAVRTEEIRRGLSLLCRTLSQGSSEVMTQLQADIDCGTDKLVEYVASADGLQLSAHERESAAAPTVQTVHETDQALSLS